MYPPTLNTEKFVPNTTLLLTLDGPVNCVGDKGFLYGKDILFFYFIFLSV